MFSFMLGLVTSVWTTVAFNLTNGAATQTVTFGDIIIFSIVLGKAVHYARSLGKF